MRDKKAVVINRIAITIDPLNSIFSKPLLVCWIPPASLPPPKTEPRVASDCCINIPITNKTDNTICM